jgi:hypothetical protein
VCLASVEFFFSVALVRVSMISCVYLLAQEHRQELTDKNVRDMYKTKQVTLRVN